MQKFITASEQQTEQLAEKLAATLCGTEIIAMYGDLGAGKTAFTRAKDDELGRKLQDLDLQTKKRAPKRKN